MRGVSLDHLGMICCLGSDPATISANLFGCNTARMTPFLLKTVGEEVPAGMVREPLAELPPELAKYNCRNHRLAYTAWLQIKDRIQDLVSQYGAHRIGVVLGSSTAGLDATEEAFRVWTETGELPKQYDFTAQHAMGSVSAVIALASGLKGPTYTLSTACSSSAKALISARGLLETGICDAVITGGVDTLCHMTQNGFDALGTVSRKISRSMSANREGLNIGEGAAFFIMTRNQGPIRFLGGGESCDAYHMSSPHPEGEGAEQSMRAALEDAELKPEDITYLNLHGTATPQNDAMEAKAVSRVMPGVYCSSTKPLTGHCLGAAGAVEAGFIYLALTSQQQEIPLPPHHWDGVADPDIPALNLASPGQTIANSDPVWMMSNSFAFGGNNCSLVLGRDRGGAS